MPWKTSTSCWTTRRCTRWHVPVQATFTLSQKVMLKGGPYVSFLLNWGLTGIFPSDFKTVEQTLYPVYGTIGVFYRLK